MKYFLYYHLKRYNLPMGNNIEDSVDVQGLETQWLDSKISSEKKC